MTKKNGFSLIEVMVALGLITTASVGFMKITKDKTTFETKFLNKLVINNEFQVIGQLLKTGVSCQSTIEGKNIDMVDLASEELTGLSILESTGTGAYGDPVYEVNTSLRPGLSLNAFRLKDFVAVNANQLKANFELVFSERNGRDHLRKVPILIEYDSSTGTLTRCLTSDVLEGMNTRKDPPEMFVAYNPDTSSWACTNIPSSTVQRMCGDIDGCTLEFFLEHETDPNDQVRVRGAKVFLEQTNSTVTDDYNGSYGWLRYDGGGDRAFILGNTTRRYKVADVWGWAYLYNYNHRECGGGSGAYPDKTLTLMSNRLVRTTLVIND